MFHTHNSLDQKVRESIIPVLNAALAHLLDLHSQVKQSHWMVRGHNFQALHELFDEIATSVLVHGDDVAERIAQLGGTPEGTVEAVAKRSTLPSHGVDVRESKRHVELVAERLAFVSEECRGGCTRAAELGDDNTADLFTEISRGLDKWTWFVESHG